jgi:hypothetical protein
MTVIQVQFEDRTVDFTYGAPLYDQKLATRIVDQQLRLVFDEAVEQDPDCDIARLARHKLSTFREKSGRFTFAEYTVSDEADCSALLKALGSMCGDRESDRFRLSLIVPLHIRFHAG